MNLKFYTEEYLILFTLCGIYIKFSSFMLCCSLLSCLTAKTEIRKVRGLALGGEILQTFIGNKSKKNQEETKQDQNLSDNSLV